MNSISLVDLYFAISPSYTLQEWLCLHETSKDKEEISLDIAAIIMKSYSACENPAYYTLAHNFYVMGITI